MTNPYFLSVKGKKFEACEVVEFRGKRTRMIDATPLFCYNNVVGAEGVDGFCKE